MIDVFSGGLVYEFSQEPNNYGLVEIKPDGDVQLLPDFLALKNQFQILPEIDYNHVIQSMKRNAKQIQGRMKSQRTTSLKCESHYANIDISKGVPDTIANSLIEAGVEVERGKFVPIDDEDLIVNSEILGVDGEKYQIEKFIRKEIDIMSGSSLKGKLRGFQNSTYDDLDYTYDSSDQISDVEFSDIDKVSKPNKIYHFFQQVSHYIGNLFVTKNLT